MEVFAAKYAFQRLIGRSIDEDEFHLIRASNLEDCIDWLLSNRSSC
jgi:hypothetical protein